MPIILRIITDTVSITALLTVALYHLISYLCRIHQETDKKDLYFSFFLFFLASYIFFDNSLSLLIFLPDKAPLYNTSGVALSTLGLSVFLLQFLYRMTGQPLINVKIPYMSYGLGILVCLLSFSVFFKGYLWYMNYIDKGAIAAYFLIFSSNFFILQKALRAKKNRSPYENIIFISSIFIVLSLFVFRIIIACDLDNYKLNNHIPVAAAVFVFPAFLTLKSREEFQELILLKEHLKEMHFQNDQSYIKRCSEFALKNNLNTGEQGVMNGLLEGLEYKEIAVELSLSLSGVKKRVHSLYRKTQVQNRTELVNSVLKVVSFKQA